MYTYNYHMLYKQFYVLKIWNSVSLACCSNTQTGFGTRVNVGSKTLSMAAADDKREVVDPGKFDS